MVLSCCVLSLLNDRTSGPIKYADVYKDLRKLWDEFNPVVDREEMGTTLRDDAKSFVADGWGTKWTHWVHANRLIVEHDDETDPLVEGLEGFGYDYADSAGSDDADGGGDDLDDNPGDDRGAVPHAAHSASASGGDAANEDVAGEGGAVGHGDVNAGDGAGDVGHDNAPDARAVAYEDALQVVLSKAKQDDDHVLVRRLLSKRTATTRELAESTTPAAAVLAKRARAQQEEMERQRTNARLEQAEAKRDAVAEDVRKTEARFVDSHSNCFG